MSRSARIFQFSSTKQIKYFYVRNKETSKRQLYEIECRNDQMISIEQQPKI